MLDLNKNKEKFNEDLILLEFDEYIIRCHEKEVIPFYGFFFDVPNVWESVERTNVPSQRVKSKELADTDHNLIKELHPNLKMDMNIDPVFKYLIEVLDN